MSNDQDLAPSILIANRAIDWLIEHLSYFEPYQGADEPLEIRQKALSELALLCLVLRSRQLLCGDPRLTAFLDFILKMYNTPRFHERLYAIKNSFVRHVSAAVALRSYNVIADDFEWQALQSFLKRSNVTHTERTPHGMLELRYLLDVGGFRHALPSYTELAQSSIVSKPVNVVYATDGEAYAFTHGLFYLSDFGLRPILGLSESQIAYAQWVVDRLLGMYIRSRNFDLTSELLVSCQCLGYTGSDTYALGWQALLEAQWPNGVLPGPYFVAQKADSLVGRKKEEYVFEQCYHTTLVTALAGAICQYAKLDDTVQGEDNEL